MAYPAPTNEIEPRLRAVEKRMLMTIMGEPALQISREGCPTLVRALASNYKYRRKTTGILDELPEKLHPWSDVADCLQYGCLSVNQNLAGRVLRRLNRPAMAEAPRPGGWT
jgi:hypothetical protein